MLYAYRMRIPCYDIVIVLLFLLEALWKSFSCWKYDVTCVVERFVVVMAVDVVDDDVDISVRAEEVCDEVVLLGSFIGEIININ